MPNKVSARLSSLLATGGPNEEQLLHILLKRDLKPREVQATLNRLSQYTDGQAPEFLARSHMAFGRIPLARVPQVAAMPEVEWLDVDREAPLENLLD